MNLDAPGYVLVFANPQDPVDHKASQGHRKDEHGTCDGCLKTGRAGSSRECCARDASEIRAGNGQANHYGC